MGSVRVYIPMSGGIGLHGPSHICSGRDVVRPNKHDALGGVKVGEFSN